MESGWVAAPSPLCPELSPAQPSMSLPSLGLRAPISVWKCVGESEIIREGFPVAGRGGGRGRS